MKNIVGFTKQEVEAVIEDWDQSPGDPWSFLPSTEEDATFDIDLECWAEDLGSKGWTVTEFEWELFHGNSMRRFELLGCDVNLRDGIDVESIAEWLCQSIQTIETRIQNLPNKSEAKMTPEEIKQMLIVGFSETGRAKATEWLLSKCNCLKPGDEGILEHWLEEIFDSVSDRVEGRHEPEYEMPYTKTMSGENEHISFEKDDFIYEETEE